MKFSDMLALIDKRTATNTLILCHGNADPDALGSAYALQGLLKKLRPDMKVTIGTEQGINQLSKNIVKHIPIQFYSNPNLDKADVIILIDTNTIQQLGNLADKLTSSDAPIIVVDHHAIHPKTSKKAKISIIYESSPSTCEIVYGFYKELKMKPDLNESTALFLGIASDTRHFTLGNSSTFKIISELGEIGINTKEALTYLSTPMSFSERIARVKACKRIQIKKIAKWIIAFSHVGSYQASAARAIIDLGAHMAAVAGVKGEKIEISLRCTKEFNRKTGIHLGKDIAQPLGEYLQGMGGGHASAAGLTGTGEVENAFKECLSLITQYIPNSA
jgi:nanoRNase/pAp phosphatase (c-di-AMP/oligoRNAs hydrolase)